MYERIDRDVANVEWCLLFQETVVVQLSNLKFDHCPILISMHKEWGVSSRSRKFLFLVTWLTNDGFKNVVKGL